MRHPREASRRRGAVKSALMIIGVIAGLVAASIGYQYLPNYDPVRLEAWNKVSVRINQTSAETKVEAEKSTAKVKEFFVERKKNARAFAEDVLSYRGKWAFVKDFFKKGNHKKYLKERFEQRIVSSDDLRTLIESVVTQYLSEVEGRENQMLIAIRADLEGDAISTSAYLPALKDVAEFRNQFDAMLEKVASVNKADTGVQVSREVASNMVGFLITKLATSLAAELGISGSILGGGAMGALETGFFTLAISLIADRIIDWAIRQTGYDPEAEIAAKVVESLDRLEEIILHGSESSLTQYNDAKFDSVLSFSSSDRQTAWGKACGIKMSGGLGLAGQMEEIDEERSKARTDALRNLILIGGVK